MQRSRILLAVLVLVLAGCRDVGLAGNIPLAEAEHKAPLPLVAEAHPPRDAGHAGVMFAGTRWVDAGLPVEIPDRDLRQVGSGHGHPLYALRWDDAPFDRIYARTPEGWQPHDPVRGLNAVEAEGEAIVH